jgi:hypothetical protein
MSTAKDPASGETQAIFVEFVLKNMLAQKRCKKVEISVALCFNLALP